MANEKLSNKQSADFSNKVLAWFADHGRTDLPWQQNPTPYRVWISEIMLQQTQVTTVIPYFERFTARYKNVQALAQATEDEVLALWTGLGYYARGRNLLAAARMMVEEFNGEFPASTEELMQLPGVGRSTAGAILSLGFGQWAPILDGNVKRVLCRYRCVEGWSGKTTVQRYLWEMSSALTPQHKAAAFNQAMMDLGATLCKRSKPECHRCPVARGCQALQSGSPTQWPEPKPKKAKPVKVTTMLLLADGAAVLLKRRPPSGIWGGLWSFPEFEDDSALHRYAGTLGQYRKTDVEHWDQVRHSFTHFDLHIRPVRIALKLGSGNRIMEGDDTRWVDGELPGGCAAPVKKLLSRLTHGVLNT